MRLFPEFFFEFFAKQPSPETMLESLWKYNIRLHEKLFTNQLWFSKVLWNGRIRLVWEEISRYVNNYNIYHFKQILKLNIHSPLNNLSGHQKKF